VLKKNSKIQAKFGGNVSAIDFDALKRTLVSFNVYYEDLSFIHFIELEKMSWVDLVAGMGGTLGLCLGMSFLSVIEFFDLIIHVALVLLKSNSTEIRPHSIHDSFKI
jgi:hypothetical protein